MALERFYETTATICGALFFASFAIAQLILDRTTSGPIGRSRVAGFLFAALVTGAIFFNGMLYSLVELLSGAPNIATAVVWARGLGVVVLLLPAVTFLSQRARTALSSNFTFAVRNDPLRVPYGIYLWLLVISLAGAISLTNDTQYSHQTEAPFLTERWIPVALFIGVGSFVALFATVFAFFTYSAEIQLESPMEREPARADLRQDSDSRLAIIAAACLGLAAIFFVLGTFVTSKDPWVFWMYQILRWFTVLVACVTADVLWNRLLNGKTAFFERAALSGAIALLLFVAILKNTAFPFQFSHVDWIVSGLDTWTVTALLIVVIALIVAAVRSQRAPPSPTPTPPSPLVCPRDLLGIG